MTLHFFMVFTYEEKGSIPRDAENWWNWGQIFWFDQNTLCSNFPVPSETELLPCDHEVMGSSPGNSLLQKCRKRLRTIDPSGRTFPRTLRKRELHALGCLRNRTARHSLAHREFAYPYGL